MIILKLLFGFTALWVIFLFILWYSQEKFIFFPPSAAKTYQPAAYQKDNIQLALNNHRLNGWYIQKDKNLPTIIYFGGNASDVGQLLSIVKQQFNANLLLLQYRGYGKSTGKPSQKALFSDALAEYDWLIKNHAVQLTQIFLIGQSLGTGVATYLASQRSVQAVVLITPYASIGDIAAKKYPYFPIHLLIQHAFPSVEFAKTIKTPLLALLAEQDQIIPREDSVRLYQAWGSEDKSLLIIKNSTHINILNSTTYQKINQFIAKYNKELP